MRVCVCVWRRRATYAQSNVRTSQRPVQGAQAQLVPTSIRRRVTDPCPGCLGGQVRGSKRECGLPIAPAEERQREERERETE